VFNSTSSPETTSVTSKSLLIFFLLCLNNGREEIEKDLNEKKEILKWMVENKINTINTVGNVISEYYSDKGKLLKKLKEKHSAEAVLGDFYSEIKK